MGAIAQLLGATLGAFLIGGLLVWLLEKFGPIRRLELNARAAVTVAVAGLLVLVLVAFGNGDGGQLDWSMGGWYIPGLVLLWMHRRRQLRKELADDRDVAAFD